MDLLIIGGSGQLSGNLVQHALAQGHRVWTLSRGRRPVPQGVTALKADREDQEQFRAAMESAGMRWDAAIDCVCMNAVHARQDIDVVSCYTDRMAVVSTDSVYHTFHKTVPQTEDAPCYMDDGGYGHHKRMMEEIFLAKGGNLRWTIFRPGHIFGPGFEIGCYPEHSRQKGLLAHIRADKPLRLVDAGRFLIHPIYVDDMSLALLDCLDKPDAVREIFCIGGPEVIPNSEYFVQIGEILGHPVTIEEIPLEGYLEANPQYSGHLCQRSYDLTKLRRAGVRTPSMPLREGLRRHIQWLDQRDGV